ncbi:monocarboxylate transporter 12-B isoform X3 [Toxotes jaculatrix]|uniref:monocarboxylate transporter 12-B isoform X2 n=1 Tax=Toxotes jaculatrix TaxID=941984 RepID=UPI001B3AA623|nr:monocarboxylate transporter 12-B isoform X2 [Toxotes jaculatrix]XP_040922525.1 monocarboxylate transporter 12-B isoform X3 [Toxotes jaculatrix]
MVDGKRQSGRASPPDGGWGWVIVGCCFMVTVCTRAVTRCISIFFVEFQAHFEADYSATAWIHSLVDCTTMLCAPVGSLVGNRWSCRVAVMFGGLLSSCGLLLSSFTTSLELLYVTMGVLTGLGFALCYTPAIAMVGCYFQQRKALAYGIAMSGSGIGTFVLAPAVQLLIELYSWRGAMLVLSAFVANLCVCGALLRPIPLREDEEEAEGESTGEERCGNVSSQDAELAVKLSKESEDRLLSSGLLASSPSNPAPQVKKRRCFGSCFLSSKEYRFLLLPDFLGLAVSFLFLASGCSLPFVYLVPYALSSGVSHQHAAFLMSILGVIDIMGNVTFGWLTDRRCLKPYRLACYIFSVGMEGLCCLFVPLLCSFPLLVPFAVLYGYFDGAYVALIPVVTSDVVGASCLSSALGVVYFLHAIPYLVSPPIGGWLVDVTGSYMATFFLSGTALLASALVLSTVAGIRQCCRRHLATKHEARPLGPSDQSDCFIAFNKEAVHQAVAS